MQKFLQKVCENFCKLLEHLFSPLGKAAGRAIYFFILFYFILQVQVILKPEKVHFILFTKKINLRDHVINIKIDDVPLGVIINEKLSWNDHICTTLSQKTTLTLHTITSVHINQFS